MPKQSKHQKTCKTNNETNIDRAPSMEPTYVSLNGWNFSRYECQVAMAIKLYIRNSNNAVPSDETVGVIINSLRGQVNGVSLPHEACTDYRTNSTRILHPSTTWFRCCNRIDSKAIGHCICRSTAPGSIGSKRQAEYGVLG